MSLNLALEEDDLVMVSGGYIVVIDSIDDESESASVEVVGPEMTSLRLKVMIDDTFMLGDAEVELTGINYALDGDLSVTLACTADRDVDIHRFHSGQSDRTLEHILHRFPLKEQKLLAASLKKIWEE